MLTSATYRSPLAQFARRPVVLEAIGLLVGLVLWEIVGTLRLIPWLPSLHEVIAKIGSLFAAGELQDPLLNSITNLVIGYVIAVVIGVVVGALMAVSKYVDLALRVYVDALMAAPSIMLVPVLYVLFGLSKVTLVLVIILYASVFIIVNTRSAVVGASRNLAEMARSFGAGPLAAFFWVTLRSAGPGIFAGLRIGMGRAVKGMFNGELFIAVTGLAALDKQFHGAFDTTGILAIAMVVIVLAVGLATSVAVADRRLNGWVSSPE